MAQVCRMCSLDAPVREEAEARAKRDGYRAVAARHGMSKSSVERHMRHHRGPWRNPRTSGQHPPTSHQAARAVVVRLENTEAWHREVEAEYAQIRDAARGMFAKAASEQDWPEARANLREWRVSLDALVGFRGILGDAVEREAAIVDRRDFMELAEALLTALTDYPEARRAAARVLLPPAEPAA